MKVNVTAGQITNVTDNKPPTRPKDATDIETRGHEKDVTPEKPKKKAEQPASETDSAPESQQIFGYTSPDTTTPSDSTPLDSAGTSGGTTPTIIIPPTETYPDLLPDIADTTAPVITITPSASPEAGDFAAGSFSISSDEAATYSYNLDALGWTSTGASLTISGLTEGPHTLDIQATDSAGNLSSINTLSFSMSRYSLAGSFYVTKGSAVSTATGEVAGISNQSWGGWNINTGGAVPSTLYAGGTSSDSLASNDKGYWLLIAPGTTTFKYLSYDRYGTGAGIVSGTYTETPLAHSGKIVPDGNSNGSLTTAGLYSMDTSGPWLDIEGNSTGLMGGVASPWSQTTAVNYMGKYDVSGGIGYGPPYLWTPEISSYNVKNATNTTFDGGAYKGFIGGVWKGDGTIDAKVYSLYIDPSGNAGILKGTVTGAYYPQLNMFEADGTWTPTVMATGLDAATATVNIVTTDYGYSITSSGGFNVDSFTTVAGNEMLSATDWRYSISGQDWGIWKSIIGGDYTADPTTSDTWSLSTFVDLSGGTVNTIYGTQTDGTQWSNGVLAGKTYGYGADITTTPNTWISVGETRGTFDPTDSTWQAVQTAAWMETNKFLDMAGCSGGVCSPTAENKATLAQLNIPAVEVGRANLSGSGNGLIVNMNDVIFFAPNNGQAPGIWATGNVNGTYSTAPNLGQAVTLAGNGLTTSFTPQTWDTGANKWAATVNGGGTYTGTGTMNNTTVQMNGAGAGTINTGDSTFAGTAAGTAK